jgi:hypothetical protein
MIFLLPPSETKESGGRAKPKNLSFPKLSTARSLIQKALIELSKNPKQASIALKLGPTQKDEIKHNLLVAKAPTMAALDRYTGVLFDALKLGGLTSSQRKLAGKKVFIQSSLFGLISAMDEIPTYRLSAGSKVPNVSLKKIWMAAHQEIWPEFQNEIVIDLRSKAYAALAPIPVDIKSYQVEVLVEDNQGNRRALNHFNKQAKGQFVRAVLTSSAEPKSLADLKKVARLAGLKIEIEGKELLLITHG